ncbi:hypothetical protein Tco_1495239, partial [Tanacetum coccineum]
VGYGIEDVWDNMVGDIEERASTTVEGLSQRVTNLSSTLAWDTHEIYVQFEDPQDDQALQRAQFNTLFRDRRHHLHIAVLVQTHKTHNQTRDACIGSLETLVATLVAQTLSLQTQLTTALGRIQTLEAREPARTDDPKDKMAPRKRTARASPATTTTPSSTRVTDAQLRTLIERGVAAVLAERDADRSRNGDDNHDSGTGERRQASIVHECTYTDFLKCQPMNFKGTEGVFGLT